jgi:hypothetical protein
MLHTDPAVKEDHSSSSTAAALQQELNQPYSSSSTTIGTAGQHQQQYYSSRTSVTATTARQQQQQHDSSSKSLTAAAPPPPPEQQQHYMNWPSLLAVQSSVAMCIPVKTLAIPTATASELLAAAAAASSLVWNVDRGMLYVTITQKPLHSSKVLEEPPSSPMRTAVHQQLQQAAFREKLC